MKEIFSFKQELARKFVHLLSLFIILIYWFISSNFSRTIALLILVLILIIFLELEYIRLEIGRKIPILHNIWKYVRREKEKEKLGGDVYFLIGAILCFAIFDLRIAVAAILMTTFGDMSAALIGKRFGRHWLKHLKERAWEGILAELIVNILIGFIILFWRNFSNLFILQNWIIILVMAVTATFVETIIYKMDDNLLIPIIAGFNGQVVLPLFRLMS